MKEDCTVLQPEKFFVCTDDGGDFSSLSEALAHCCDGDTVLVGEGVYSPATTGEVFPLFVPNGVTMEGQGEGTIADGRAMMRLSTRPLNPYESLFLLGDRSKLQRVQIRNSGGNGLSHLQGARFEVSHCLIRDNGQHGILLLGPGEAIIRENSLINNGTSRYDSATTPLPAPGMQGHHIYFEGLANMANQASIEGNTMVKAFADAVALVPYFDEPDSVTMDVRIANNRVEQCGRSGVLVAASYGTNRSTVVVEVVDNLISRCEGAGVSAATAFPLIRRMVEGASLKLEISGNTIEHTLKGIDAVCAFSPARDCKMDLRIEKNTIRDSKEQCLWIAGAGGAHGLPVHENRMQAIVLNNQLLGKEGTHCELHACLRKGAAPVFDNELKIGFRENSCSQDEVTVYEDRSGKNRVVLGDFQ